MSRITDYTKLRSADDVHRQLKRVNKHIAYLEEDIEDDINALGKYFSLDYWRDYAVDRIATLSPKLMTFMIVGRSLINFFQEKKRRRRR